MEYFLYFFGFAINIRGKYSDYYIFLLLLTQITHTRSTLFAIYV